MELAEWFKHDASSNASTSQWERSRTVPVAAEAQPSDTKLVHSVPTTAGRTGWTVRRWHLPNYSSMDPRVARKAVAPTHDTNVAARSRANGGGC